MDIRTKIVRPIALFALNHFFAGTWIGTHVVVVGETRIGAGCVVAGGSVVAKSAGDNTLLAGVPAVVKKELM